MQRVAKTLPVFRLMICQALGLLLVCLAPAVGRQTVSKARITAHNHGRNGSPHAAKSPNHAVTTPPPEARAATLEMLGPLPLAPKSDRLVSLTPGPPFRGGTLVYSEYVPIPGKMMGWGGIVLRKLDPAAPDPVTTYYITPPVQVYYSIEPQFVGGRRYLVIKEGDYPFDQHAWFCIYLLDLQTHRLISGPAIGFYYPTIKVSPDGRYLALVEGGDSRGYSMSHGEKMGILIYDVETHQSHEASLSEEGPSLAWTNQGTLLYSAPGPPYRDKHGRVTVDDPAVTVFSDTTTPIPAIFQTPARGGHSILVARNAESPLPSPDGKWMFFRGWPDSTEAANGVVDPVVQGESGGRYFFDRTFRKRHIIPYGIFTDEDRLLWMADSQRILRLRDSYERDGTAGCELSTLQFVVDGKPDFAPKAKVITTLHAKDFQSANHSVTHPQFQPLHFSRDGQILYFQKTEITSIDATNNYTWKHTLEAVDLRTGTVTDLAQTHDDMGMDWLEPPSQAARLPAALVPPHVSAPTP